MHCISGRKNEAASQAESNFLDRLTAFVNAVLAVMLVYSFLLDPVRVDGISMEDTLFDNDRLIIRTLFYKPARGDVVVCRSDMLGELIIKRVIALGGQRVTIDYEEGVVTVDGEAITEPYVKYHSFDDNGSFDMKYYDPERGVYEYEVPAGSVFLMGDNRNHSNDSRKFGAVSESDVVGKAVFRFYSERAKTGKIK